MARSWSLQLKSNAEQQPIKVAIIGTGPAGLMAADVLASAGCAVSLYEKRKGASWKLYIAGSSGLNISNSLPLPEFMRHYTGPAAFWPPCLHHFSPTHWLNFIEKELGLGTFLGTSGRYFVQTMHAAKLIRLWRQRLQHLGAKFYFDHECIGFEAENHGFSLNFRQEQSQVCDAICFSLGGASWENSSARLAWPEIFLNKNIKMQAFASSNTGYEVSWSPAFLKEAEGKPLKNINLRSSRGERQGDLIITEYGVEGTPVYFTGECGTLSLDLKPDLSIEAITAKLTRSKENLAPLRRAQKYLALCPAAKALLYHMAPPSVCKSLSSLAEGIKNFPLHLNQPRPLSEAISSQGGIAWEELEPSLMLKKFPGVYCAGEMIDWDAPTGGFLIQACISQGAWAAKSLLETLNK